MHIYLQSLLQKYRLHKDSVSYKLELIIMSVLLITMVLIFGANVWLNINNNLERSENDLRVFANVVSQNLQGALAFNDTKGLEDVLQSLHANPNIEFAEVLNNNNQVLASYKPELTTVHHVSGWLTILPVNHSLNITRPIELNNKTLGLLSIKANIDDVWFSQIMLMLQMIAVLLVALPGAILLSKHFTKIFVTPLKHMAMAAKRITLGGDYSLRVVQESNDEIGQLANEFNTMLEAITQRDQALKESEFLWKFAIEGAGDGVWDWNIETDEARYSTLWKSMLGYSEGDILPTNDEWATRVHPDDQTYVQQAMQDYLTGKSNSYRVEYKLRCKDNSYKWILGRGMVVSRSADGRPLRMIGTHTDITQRKQMEEMLRQSQNTLATTMDGVEAYIYLKDMQGRYLFANRSVCELFGKPLSEIVGQTDDQFFDAATAMQLHENDRLVLQSGETLKKEETNLNLRTGLSSTYLSVKLPLRKTSGEIYALCGISTDITDRILAEQERLANEAQISAFYSMNLVGLTITSPEKGWVRTNDCLCKMLEYSEEELRTMSWVDLTHPEDLAADIEQFNRVLANEIDGYSIEKRFISRSGKVIPTQLVVRCARKPDGEVDYIMAMVEDITQRKEDALKIQQLAFYDTLTQLPNRRLLLDRLNQALVFSTRSGRHGALLFLDLDHFKTLNDTLGHDIGDLLLQQVANRLSACVREGDTVARLGGDEFIILLEDLSEDPMDAAAQAEAIGAKMLTSINQEYQLAHHTYFVTSSIGVTIFSNNSIPLDELMKRADIAMYQTKRTGRNGIRFFDPKMQASIETRSELERWLSAALNENKFMLYYQPQVNSVNKVVGAEETGMIVAIGQWVLETACNQLKVWESYPDKKDLQLAVNVSAKQFQQNDFVNQVIKVLDKTGVNPKLLKLELTESMVLDNIAAIIEKMRILKDVGVKFSMDDFGTGHSSLSSLKKLPLDQLKIDQSFVRDIAIDQDDAIIVQTIIAMANSLSMEVIAEGVETLEQKDFLTNHCCLHFQGYLFGRPMPINEFEALLSNS